MSIACEIFAINNIPKKAQQNLKKNGKDFNWLTKFNNFVTEDEY